MSSALAVDRPATVPLTGQVRDTSGSALAGVPLVVAEELPPDGGLAGWQVTTAGDGTFAVGVLPWGTADAPATVTIRADPAARVRTESGGCSRTFAVSLSDTRPLSLAETLAPAAIDLVATTRVVGEVCGATATAPSVAAGLGAPARGDGPTPPPTDGLSSSLDRSTDRPATALLVGFGLGFVLALLFVLPRSGLRRRD
ncbi:MAG TPA: hypothetical protein VH440_06620 [Candidatus Limnocylindrales bacterium]